MTDTQQHSVLAVHPGALGDVVLFGHLLGALEGRRTLVAGGEKARLLAGLGVADAALDFDSLPMHEVFSETPPGQCRLPGLLGRHDRLISCFGAGDARAERRLAELAGAAEAAFLPTRPPAEFKGHLLDLWCRALAIDGPPEPAPWSVSAAWRREAADTLKALHLPAGRPYVAIHPGAGAENKCWPLDRFLAVARGLRDGGVGVVFVLGPVERERWRDGRVERIQGAFPVMLGEGLGVLAGVLSEAAGYLGNDSGVSHLAAAVGAPTVAMFGPTEPRHFRPIGRAVRVLAAGEITEIPAERALGALGEMKGAGMG